MYKSTNFLANHNIGTLIGRQKIVVVGCTKVLISQLITTSLLSLVASSCCCWMYKSTNFLANHNNYDNLQILQKVVVGCTKVLISQLITTSLLSFFACSCCCWMYKSTNFLANHNMLLKQVNPLFVVVGCTKVLISQLITTKNCIIVSFDGCCWMYKSTNFLANHNIMRKKSICVLLLLDVQKY